MSRLKPVSEGVTSTIIFRESSEKRANIVQPELPSVALSSSDLLSHDGKVYPRIFPPAFPSHRLREKYAANEVVVETSAQPCRVKVTMTINVGPVHSGHVISTYIDVKILRRVKRPLMVRVETFCIFLCYVTSLSYLCVLFMLVHYMYYLSTLMASFHVSHRYE